MNQDWLDWTRLNLGRGCDPEEIRNILRNNGFSDGEIENAMSQNAEQSLWGKVRDRLGGRNKSSTKNSKASDASTQQDSSDTKVTERGIQPGLDYARLAKPNLLANTKLNTVAHEGIQLYYLDNFMSKEECTAVISVMQKNLRPSTITTGADYGGFRTSTTCDLGHQSAKIVEKIDKKIARTLGVRLPWSEVIQGQKYEVGQEFKAHTDYFEPGSKEFKKFASELGQRTWTFMVYLNETERGGATKFTEIDKTFYPKRGRAVIWNNLNEDGSPNPMTKHHGMPVEAGCKMIITKWFRDKGPGNPLYARADRR